MYKEMIQELDRRITSIVEGIVTIQRINNANFRKQRIRIEGSVKYNDRGDWSQETAELEEGHYYANEFNPVLGMVETSVVYHGGCRWECLVSGTTEEPSPDATDWRVVEDSTSPVSIWTSRTLIPVALSTGEWAEEGIDPDVASQGTQHVTFEAVIYFGIIPEAIDNITFVPTTGIDNVLIEYSQDRTKAMVSFDITSFTSEENLDLVFTFFSEHIESEGRPVTITLVPKVDGKDGERGDAGAGVSRIRTEYIANTGATPLATEAGFDTTEEACFGPELPFLWQRVTVTTTEGLVINTPTWTLVSHYGADGANTVAQYSVDADNWHDIFTLGDVWMRLSVNGGSWGDPIKIVGEDGQDGEYTSYSFAISARLTTTDVNTPPSDIQMGDWHDAPLATTSERPYLWIRTARYTRNEAGVLQRGLYYYTRMTGKDGASIASVVEEYIANTGTRPAATDTGSATPEDAEFGQDKPYLWNRETILSNLNEVLNTPTWSLVGYMGKDGVQGESTKAEYSVDGLTNWHSTFTDGDIWMHVSSDNGTTWSDPIKIVGEDGRDGVDGEWTDYSFALSAQLTTANVTTPPSDVTTWSDAPLQPTQAKPYLWMRIIRHYIDGDEMRTGTAHYMRMNGADGAPGTSFYATYHDSQTRPARPTGSGNTNGWHRTADSNCVWISTKEGATINDGVWSDPIKISGTDGTSVNIKGRVDSEEDLLGIVNPAMNDTYMVTETGHMWAYDGQQWQDLGKIQGEPGQPGEPGVSTYMHIKYSDDGISFTPAQNGKAIGETLGAYLGILVDHTLADSTVFADYTWHKIEGADALFYAVETDSMIISQDVSGSAKAPIVISCYTIRGSSREALNAYISTTVTKGSNTTTTTRQATTYTLTTTALQEVESVRIDIRLTSGGTIVDTVTLRAVRDGQAGTSVFATYHDSQTRPARPTGSGNTNGWHRTADADCIWVSFKQAATVGDTGVEWSVPIKIAGTDGTSISVKDTVATAAQLPTTGVNDGDAYVVEATNHIYVWSQTKGDWVDLGEYKGDPGQSNYVHIKYSDDGLTFTPAQNGKAIGETIGKYIGMYVDSVQADSEIFDDYKPWHKIEGDDATMYHIEASSSIIAQDNDGTASDNLTFSFYKYVGAVRAAEPVYYKITSREYDGTQSTETNGTKDASVTIQKALLNKAWVKVEIYATTTDRSRDENRLAYETVYGIRNGADGQSLTWDDLTEAQKEDLRGEDGTSIEFIYRRQAASAVANANLPGNSNTDRYVPTGWTDHPTGVTSSQQYEFVCMRTKYNGAWGNWGAPALWSKYGERGQDGDGVEYIFYLTTESNPANIATPTASSKVGWTNNPSGVTEAKPYEYVSKRTKSNGTWSAYSAPALWAKFSKDGVTPHVGQNGNWYLGDHDTGVPASPEDPDVWTIGSDGYWYLNGVKQNKKAIGSDGQSVFVSYVFKRSSTLLDTAPTGGSYSSPYPTDTSWHDGVPSGTAPVYMSQRVFTSDGQAPQSSTWTTPCLMCDTSDIDICFSASSTQPAANTLPAKGSNTDNATWHNEATSSDIWMAVATKVGGVWSNWQVTKIRGENGRDGADAVRENLFGDDCSIIDSAYHFRAPTTTKESVALMTRDGIFIYTNAATATRQYAISIIEGIVGKDGSAGDKFMASFNLAATGSQPLTVAVVTVHTDQTFTLQPMKVGSSATTVTTATMSGTTVSGIAISAEITLMAATDKIGIAAYFAGSSTAFWSNVTISRLKIEDGNGLAGPTAYCRKKNQSIIAIKDNLFKDGETFSALSESSVWTNRAAVRVDNGFATGIPSAKSTGRDVFLRQTVTGLIPGEKYTLSFYMKMQNSSFTSLGVNITNARGVYYDSLTDGFYSSNGSNIQTSISTDDTDSSQTSKKWILWRITFTASAASSVVSWVDSGSGSISTYYLELALIKLELGERRTATNIELRKRNITTLVGEKLAEQYQGELASARANTGAATADRIVLEGTQSSPTSILVSSPGSVSISAANTEKVTIDPSPLGEGEIVRLYITGCVTEAIIPKNVYTGKLGETKGRLAERVDYLGTSNRTIDEIVEEHMSGQGIIRIEAKGGQIYGLGSVMGSIDSWDPQNYATANEWFSVFNRASRLYASDGVLEFQKVGGNLHLIRNETFESFLAYRYSDRFESSSNGITLNVWSSPGLPTSVVPGSNAVIIPRMFYRERTQWIVANTVIDN